MPSTTDRMRPRRRAVHHGVARSRGARATRRPAQATKVVRCGRCQRTFEMPLAEYEARRANGCGYRCPRGHQRRFTNPEAVAARAERELRTYRREVQALQRGLAQQVEQRTAAEAIVEKVGRSCSNSATSTNTRTRFCRASAPHTAGSSRRCTCGQHS